MGQEMMMMLFGVLPAFALVGYVCWLDRRQPEPLSWIFRGMGYGVGSVLLALLLDGLMASVMPCTAAEGTVSRGLYTAFLQAAVPEETAKLVMLWLLVKKNPYFDERMDGIVYAVAVAMGFAACENVGYLFDNVETWQSVAFSRALFSVPAHFAFAVLMGYYYGLVHFDPERYGRYRLMVLLSPVVAHGVFDGLLMVSPALGEGLAAVVYVVFLYFCIRLHRFCRTRVTAQLQRDKRDLDAQAFAKALGQFGHYSKDERA